MESKLTNAVRLTEKVKADYNRAHAVRDECTSVRSPVPTAFRVRPMIGTCFVHRLRPIRPAASCQGVRVFGSVPERAPWVQIAWSIATPPPFATANGLPRGQF